MRPPLDTETKVRAVLEAAGLNPSDEELEVYVRMYPHVRAMADSLYIPEIEYEEIALRFDPAV
jgi:hypothetical protein